jgi:hypothetical protein
MLSTARAISGMLIANTGLCGIFNDLVLGSRLQSAEPIVAYLPILPNALTGALLLCCAPSPTRVVLLQNGVN